jgi:hypothetical protein
MSNERLECCLFFPGDNCHKQITGFDFELGIRIRDRLLTALDGND